MRPNPSKQAVETMPRSENGLGGYWAFYFTLSLSRTTRGNAGPPPLLPRAQALRPRGWRTLLRRGGSQVLRGRCGGGLCFWLRIRPKHEAAGTDGVELEGARAEGAKIVGVRVPGGNGEGADDDVLARAQTPNSAGCLSPGLGRPGVGSASGRAACEGSRGTRPRRRRGGTFPRSLSIGRGSPVRR